MTQQSVLDQLAAQMEPEVAAAFEAAIADLATGADLQRVMVMLQVGDVEGAIQALHLDPAAYGPVLEAVRKVYVGGGQGIGEAISASALRKGARFVIRFNVRNPEAEAWLAQHAATLVTNLVADQRAAARAALQASLAAGANPRTAALDLVGRIDKATGKRAGGIIGLTSQQEEFARNAAAELSGGDLANYLTRSRRDKRFDSTIKKALASGEPVPAATARKAVVAYRRRLLQLRGETVAKLETFSALAASRDEAFRQAIADGKIDAGAVTKTWRHFPNREPRLQHIAMNGKTVRFGEAFILPDGTRMQYPHDPAAPVKHTAGCHCQADYRIDFLRGL